MKKILTIALAPLLWGTTYLVSTELLPGFHPLLIATVRALPAGVLLVLVSREPLTGIWWIKTFVLGMLNIGIFFSFLFIATFRLPGGIAATLGAIQPLLVILLGSIILKTSVTISVLWIIGLGILGVTLLVFTGSNELNTLGVISAILGAFSMALGIVLTKKWGRPISLLGFTGWQLVFGGIVTGIILGFIDPSVPVIRLNHLLGILWLSLINSAFAYYLWFQGIEHLKEPWKISLIGFFSPLVATILGWFVLNQRMTTVQLLGIGFILLSIILSQVQTKKVGLKNSGGIPWNNEG